MNAPTHLRFQVRTAVTWRLIAELFRHHHPMRRLRVLETHPGGGQYDCLTLLLTRAPDQGPYSAHDQSALANLCVFNQESQHLHIWGQCHRPRADLESLRWPGGNDYVHAFLATADLAVVVDQIEDLLGLPRNRGTHLPEGTAEVLVYRVVAQLLDRYSLSRLCLDIRMGWCDTSGEGGGMREELRRFPEFETDLPPADQDSSNVRMMDYAAQHWLLYLRSSDAQPRMLGLFRTNGSVYGTERPERRYDLTQQYRAVGRRLDRLADQAIAWLGIAQH